MPMLVGKTLLALTGGMFLLAYVISRKVDKMMPGVAVATLIAYASLQGIVFGCVLFTLVLQGTSSQLIVGRLRLAAQGS